MTRKFLPINELDHILKAFLKNIANGLMQILNGNLENQKQDFLSLQPFLNTFSHKNFISLNSL